MYDVRRSSWLVARWHPNPAARSSRTKERVSSSGSMVPQTSLTWSVCWASPRSSRAAGSCSVIATVPRAASSICGRSRSSRASDCSSPIACPRSSNQLAGTCWSTPSASQRTAATAERAPISVGAVLAYEVEDLLRELGPTHDEVRQQHVVLVVDERRAVHAAGEQPGCPGHDDRSRRVPLVLAAGVHVGVADVADH